MTGLRFAPLIRVSTERQEKQGESLKTQKTDLYADIKYMGGDIYKWYEGQEHSTPDYERKKLDELIRDAQQNKFDAVIIWSIDRWSRDNLSSEQGLKILKDNHIKFFVRTKEYDLFNTSDYFIIAMYVLMGRTQAIEQSRKSILNKIHRAKQGKPTCGRLPYGRTYTKKQGWGINNEKQKIIEDAARRYLEGECLDFIAESYKMNRSNLNKILKRRSGDTWSQKFRSKRCNIYETVITNIPRLLSEEIITKINQRSEGNKTYTHGQSKNKYLLSRMIFCEECGHPSSGTPNHNHNGKLYYRHSNDCGCKSFNYIPADIIENAVMDDIFQMLGDLPRIEQATKDAIPDLKERDELKRKIEQDEKDLIKIKKMKEKLLDLAENGKLPDDEIKERMDKHRETETLLRSKIDSGKSKLKNIPSEKDIKMRSGILLRLTRNILKRKKHLDEEMTFDDKRKLLQNVFGGKDADGKRYGVYIRKLDNGRWYYTINGLFYDSKGTARKLDISDTAPKIYADEYIYEPLEDSEPIIDSTEDADAFTVEARASYMQRMGEYDKQDMLCL